MAAKPKKSARGAEEMYWQIVRIRGFIFSPLVKTLNSLKVTPDMVTAAGTLFMLLFIFYLKKSLGIAFLCLILTQLADLVDGVLARYQQKATDRGKFKDMVVDNLNFTLFAGSLVWAQLVAPLAAGLLIYTMVLSKLFHCLIKSVNYKSDWFFHPVAGPIPNTVVFICLILFLFLTVDGVNILSEGFYILGGGLTVDVIVNFYRIVRRKSNG